MKCISIEEAKLLDSAEICKRLETSDTCGLDNNEANSRLRIYGYNEFNVKEEETLFSKYIEQVNCIINFYQPNNNKICLSKTWLFYTCNETKITFLLEIMYFLNKRSSFYIYKKTTSMNHLAVACFKHFMFSLRLSSSWKATFGCIQIAKSALGLAWFLCMGKD